MSIATLKTLVLNTVAAGDVLQTAALALKARAETMTLPDYTNAVAEILGEKYGVAPHASRKGGLLTFEKDTAAHQRLKALLKLHPGKVSEKVEVEIPEEILKAAAALKALCDEYEKSKSLANTALATVYAK